VVEVAGCILMQFLISRTHGQSLESFGHGFYCSIAKRSLQKYAKNSWSDQRGAVAQSTAPHPLNTPPATTKHQLDALDLQSYASAFMCTVQCSSAYATVSCRRTFEITRIAADASGLPRKYRKLSMLQLVP